MRLVLASLLLVATGLPAHDAADRLRSDANKVRVRMSVAKTVDADTARLRGRVTGRDTVVIQRYAATKHRWIRVQRLRASSEGVFLATVRRTQRRERYRAVAGRAQSPARVVPPVDPADGCGQRPVKDNGTRWSCTFVEDFDGTELDRTLWMPHTGFPSGSDSGRPCYVDDPSVISVRDGALHLSVREVPEPLDCPGLKKAPTAHIAGMVSTYRLFSQQYGRFEARIKNTATEQPGLQEAFWLWPDDRYDSQLWPAAGEIDIAETYSNHPELAIPFLHYTWNDNGGPHPGLNTAWNCPARRGVFNIFTLEWSASRLEILVNGTSCLVNTSGDPAFRKRYIVALTQALGAAGNEYDGGAPLPATMTVDYVKVWE
jgi:hypothetical protein